MEREHYCHSGRTNYLKNDCTNVYHGTRVPWYHGMAILASTRIPMIPKVLRVHVPRVHVYRGTRYGHNTIPRGGTMVHMDGIPLIHVHGTLAR